MPRCPPCGIHRAITRRRHPMPIGRDRRSSQSSKLLGLRTTANQQVASGVFWSVRVGHSPRTRPEIHRSRQWIHRHLSRSSRPALGVMMKWWVIAPSGPEKLDDGEPQRYGKTTTITHFIDSGPYRNERRYQVAVNDYRQQPAALSL
ncbi:hypothetical protein EVAR_12691_1 [Eumeta japonica]|uniref:Uncharacterized protein n=1 Tax=Eumeta variegata TaxID=151549 RepID=A0A4C1UNK6_EUMVA|nr:hypothetical protein EVAR_12691_1 [Eumeta japonica]